MPPESQPSTAAVRGYLLVLLAASLWATLGVIYTLLARAGLAAITVAALRAGLGGLLLLAGLLILRRDWLRINRRALRVVLLYGIFGVALFYASYVNAILSVGVAVAAVLLYTAPAWVALIAWRFLGEQLTRRHAGALLLTLFGTALVAQVFRTGVAQINVAGILWGLLAGLTYGLWSVFNKVGVRHTNPWTLQCYGMLVGGCADRYPAAAGAEQRNPHTTDSLLAAGADLGANRRGLGGLCSRRAHGACQRGQPGCNAGAGAGGAARVRGFGRDAERRTTGRRRADPAGSMAAAAANFARPVNLKVGGFNGIGD
ncbi:MAG: DMT family transporter [Caldilineales bacterium]